MKNDLMEDRFMMEVNAVKRYWSENKHMYCYDTVDSHGNYAMCSVSWEPSERVIRKRDYYDKDFHRIAWNYYE